MANIVNQSPESINAFQIISILLSIVLIVLIAISFFCALWNFKSLSEKLKFLISIGVKKIRTMVEQKKRPNPEYYYSKLRKTHQKNLKQDAKEKRQAKFKTVWEYLLSVYSPVHDKISKCLKRKKNKISQKNSVVQISNNIQVQSSNRQMFLNKSQPSMIQDLISSNKDSQKQKEKKELESNKLLTPSPCFQIFQYICGLFILWFIVTLITGVIYLTVEQFSSDAYGVFVGIGVLSAVLSSIVIFIFYWYTVSLYYKYISMITRQAMKHAFKVVHKVDKKEQQQSEKKVLNFDFSGQQNVMKKENEEAQLLFQKNSELSEIKELNSVKKKQFSSTGVFWYMAICILLLLLVGIILVSAFFQYKQFAAGVFIAFIFGSLIEIFLSRILLVALASCCKFYIIQSKKKKNPQDKKYNNKGQDANYSVFEDMEYIEMANKKADEKYNLEKEQKQEQERKLLQDFKRSFEQHQIENLSDNQVEEGEFTPLRKNKKGHQYSQRKSTVGKGKKKLVYEQEEDQDVSNFQNIYKQRSDSLSSKYLHQASQQQGKLNQSDNIIDELKDVDQQNIIKVIDQKQKEKRSNLTTPKTYNSQVDIHNDDQEIKDSNQNLLINRRERSQSKPNKRRLDDDQQDQDDDGDDIVNPFHDSESKNKDNKQQYNRRQSIKTSIQVQTDYQSSPWNQFGEDDDDSDDEDDDDDDDDDGAFCNMLLNPMDDLCPHKQLTTEVIYLSCGKKNGDEVLRKLIQKPGDLSLDKMKKLIERDEYLDQQNQKEVLAESSQSFSRKNPSRISKTIPYDSVIQEMQSQQSGSVFSPRGSVASRGGIGSRLNSKRGQRISDQVDQQQKQEEEEDENFDIDNEQDLFHQRNNPNMQNDQEKEGQGQFELKKQETGYEDKLISQQMENSNLNRKDDVRDKDKDVIQSQMIGSRNLQGLPPLVNIRQEDQASKDENKQKLRDDQDDSVPEIEDTDNSIDNNLQNLQQQKLSLLNLDKTGGDGKDSKKRNLNETIHSLSNDNGFSKEELQNIEKQVKGQNLKVNSEDQSSKKEISEDNDDQVIKNYERELKSRENEGDEQKNSLDYKNILNKGGSLGNELQDLEQSNLPVILPVNLDSGESSKQSKDDELKKGDQDNQKLKSKRKDSLEVSNQDNDDEDNQEQNNRQKFDKNHLKTGQEQNGDVFDQNDSHPEIQKNKSQKDPNKVAQNQGQDPHSTKQKDFTKNQELHTIDDDERDVQKRKGDLLPTTQSNQTAQKTKTQKKLPTDKTPTNRGSQLENDKKLPNAPLSECNVSSIMAADDVSPFAGMSEVRFGGPSPDILTQNSNKFGKGQKLKKRLNNNKNQEFKASPQNFQISKQIFKTEMQKGNKQWDQSFHEIPHNISDQIFDGGIHFQKGITLKNPNPNLSGSEQSFGQNDMVMQNQEQKTQSYPRKKYGSKKKRPEIGAFLSKGSFEKQSDGQNKNNRSQSNSGFGFHPSVQNSRIFPDLSRNNIESDDDSSRIQRPVTNLRDVKTRALQSALETKSKIFDKRKPKNPLRNKLPPMISSIDTRGRGFSRQPQQIRASMNGSLRNSFSQDPQSSFINGFRSIKNQQNDMNQTNRNFRMYDVDQRKEYKQWKPKKKKFTRQGSRSKRVIHGGQSIQDLYGRPIQVTGIGVAGGVRPSQRKEWEILHKKLEAKQNSLLQNNINQPTGFPQPSSYYDNQFYQSDGYNSSGNQSKRSALNSSNLKSRLDKTRTKGFKRKGSNCSSLQNSTLAGFSKVKTYNQDDGMKKKKSRAKQRANKVNQDFFEMEQTTNDMFKKIKNPSTVNIRQPDSISIKDTQYALGDDTWAQNSKKVKVYNQKIKGQANNIQSPKKDLRIEDL